MQRKLQVATGRVEVVQTHGPFLLAVLALLVLMANAPPNSASTVVIVKSILAFFIKVIAF
jgi:hypothetical protein